MSQQLKDKYVNAADLLKTVMLQAKVSSTGEVLAIDPVLQPDGSYQVVVSAHQTTRNLQNPTPKVSIILLQVTLNKVGNAWQVTISAPRPEPSRPKSNRSRELGSRGSPRSRCPTRTGSRTGARTGSRARSGSCSGQTSSAATVGRHP